MPDILAGTDQTPPPPVPNVSGVAAGTPPPVVTPPPAPPTAAQANLAHSALVGHGFKSLVSSMGGTTTQYQQTPDGPQPVEVKNSGSDFFKHILAGAILGAGAGAETPGTGSGWRGAGAGINAVHANDQQAQQQRQQQAQLQFQNKQAADKAAIEANAAQTEDTMRKAQTQMFNYQALEAQQRIHQGDYTAHEGLVKDYAPQVATFEANGLTPVRQNVTEEDHVNWLKDHPGDYGSLIWAPVGVQNYVDKTGQIAYQTVWNAYDPKGKLEVSPDQLKDWKPILDKNPALAAGLKPDANGKVTLPYDAIRGIQSQANQMRSITKQKEQDDYTTKHNTAELQHLADQSAAEKAAAAASGSESALRSFERKQQKSAATAQANLAKANGDWTKLAPGDKVALQPIVQDEIKSLRNELSDPVLKEQLGSDDPAQKAAGQERATSLHRALDDAQSRSIFVSPTAAAPANPKGPAVAAANTILGAQPPSSVEDALSKLDKIPSIAVDPSNGLSDEARAQVEAEIRSRYAGADARKKDIDQRTAARQQQEQNTRRNALQQYQNEHPESAIVTPLS